MKWERKKLGQLCKVITKGTTPTTLGYKFTKSGIPFLRVQNIQNGRVIIDNDIYYIDEKTDKALFRSKISSGDVLLSIAGTIGRSAVVENNTPNLNCNQAVAIIRPTSEIDPYYLRCWLTTNDAHSQIQGGKVTATVSNFSLTQITQLKAPTPPIEIQTKIVKLITKAESTLEKRRQTLRLADEFLKSAFLEMFGDPAMNSKKLKVVPCGEIASHVSSGSTPLGGEKTYLKEGILFIRSQNVLMNRLVLSKIVFISDEVHQRMNRTWVKKDDVLLNITGASIGRITFFEGEDDTANVNQHVCIIRPIKAKILPQYLSYLISMPNYQKLILGRNAGATRQAFNFNQIKRFRIPLASMGEQQKFADLVQKVEKYKEKLKQSETQLQNLFNSLLQRTFKGELF